MTLIDGGRIVLACLARSSGKVVPTMVSPWVASSLLAAGLVTVGAWRGLRRKGLHRWLPTYVRTAGLRRPPRSGEPLDVILCIGDHFEPKLGGAPPDVARSRVRTWT